MAMIRPETEMKDSGVQWIGSIPNDWKTTAIKRLCNDVYPGATPKSNEPSYWDGNIPWIPSGSCHDCEIVHAPKYITELGFANSSTKMIPANNPVLAMTGATCGNTGFVTFDTCANQSVAAYIVKNTESPKYIWYALRAANEYIETRKTGGAQGGINTEDCKNIPIPYMHLSEQQAIADYLDDTCSKIDAIIAEAKASIEEYKELKQAVIFEAVTKGIDKTVEMKESGVEGMGTIPKTWAIARFMKSNYVRARLGWKGLKAEEYVDDGYPFLSAFNIINSHLSWSEVNHITQERYDESPEIKLSIGDLVLVKDGAGIGKCARIDEMPLGEATVNSSLSVITPGDSLDYRYEYYYFMSPLFQNIISRLKNGMGVPHLTQESMKDIYLPLPDIDEQRSIADFLDSKVVELDSLLSEKDELVSDLEAYKKSLIYEVVTGKRRVV